jgi:hypothetical protein
MRWDAIDKLSPRHGEKRKITKFAWIPLVVEDKWVWLESYWSWEEYSTIFDEWTEKQRYLK